MTDCNFGRSQNLSKYIFQNNQEPTSEGDRALGLPANNRSNYKEQRKKGSADYLLNSECGRQSSAIRPNGYVGFSDLPNQIYRRATRKGFSFNIMVAGESGVGKSTLVNSLFLSEIYGKDHPGPSKKIVKTTEIDETKLLIHEKGVSLYMTVIDTPGFGDKLDNSESLKPILKYTENKLESYLNAEISTLRTRLVDERVHCCLYLIPPTGHRLRCLDRELMLCLHTKVNLIPVIGKADAMTKEECLEFKKNIKEDLKSAGYLLRIMTYTFPVITDDPAECGALRDYPARSPFAVVAGTTLVENRDGKKVRGRRYQWGVVEIDNLEHNDFMALRDLLIRTHMLDLIESTASQQYETYRQHMLVSVSDSKSLGASPMHQFEDDKDKHDAKMQKMSAEMENVFQMKVKEKLSRIKEQEDQYQREANDRESNLRGLTSDLENKRRIFEREKSIWEEAEQQQQEQRRRNLLDQGSGAKTFDGYQKKKDKKFLF